MTTTSTTQEASGFYSITANTSNKPKWVLVLEQAEAVLGTADHAATAEDRDSLVRLGLAWLAISQSYKG